MACQPSARLDRRIQEVDHDPQSSSVARLADRRPCVGRRALSATAPQTDAGTAQPGPKPIRQANGDVDWRAVRDLFPLAADWTHLASFLLVSHPKPVADAIERFRRKLDADPGWIEQAAFSDSEGRPFAAVKRALADYVGGTPRGDLPDVEHDRRARDGLSRPAHPRGPGNPHHRARPLRAPRVDSLRGGAVGLRRALRRALRSAGRRQALRRSSRASRARSARRRERWA